MNFWKFLDRTLERLPGWPTERQIVMVMTYTLGFTMIVMARDNPELWRVELYKTLTTVVIVTGFVNMILAFYFSANKNDETKSENTRAAFSAIEAAANAGQPPKPEPDVVLKPGETAIAEETKR